MAGSGCGGCFPIPSWHGTDIAQDWTKESKDRATRTALHDRTQIVRGDSGKWNEDALLQHAPPIEQKPAKMSLDAWADPAAKKPTELRLTFTVGKSSR